VEQDNPREFRGYTTEIEISRYNGKEILVRVFVSCGGEGHHMPHTKGHPFLALLLIFLCTPSFHLSQGQGQAGVAEADNPDYDAAIKNGAELMKSGMYSDALHEFKNAIKLSGGKNYSPYYWLALTYNQLNDKLNTLENCDRMIALAPTDSIRALGHNVEGLALAKGGAKDQASLALAESEFRAALKLDPTNVEIHFNLGKTLALENHPDDAVAELKAYLAAAPSGRYASDARQLLPGAAETSDPETNLVGDFSPDPSNTRDDTAPNFKPPSGTVSPSFSFKTTKGDRVTLADLHGKVVLLDFWATWCGACKAAFPALEDLYDGVDKSKVVVISVSVDQNEGKWREFLSSNNPQWTQTRDADHKMRRAFVTPLYGIPSYILIDGNGVIRDRFTGWSSRIGSRLETEIARWSAALPSSSHMTLPNSSE
jgi:thiol-disulfide isomerase/thioredoxin